MSFTPEALYIIRSCHDESMTTGSLASYSIAGAAATRIRRRRFAIEGPGPPAPEFKFGVSSCAGFQVPPDSLQDTD